MTPDLMRAGAQARRGAAERALAASAGASASAPRITGSTNGSASACRNITVAPAIQASDSARKATAAATGDSVNAAAAAKAANTPETAPAEARLNSRTASRRIRLLIAVACM